ncbi:MAG TPA: hypothetical protein PKI62_07515 [bacterium]|nr:hypothetical protein [bacterium]HPR86609.1 hypothetical protein [bacterium]
MQTKSLRTGLILALGLLSAVPGMAQRRSQSSYRPNLNSKLGIHAGYLNPKDPDGGMLAGCTLGTSVDESVTIGLGLDLWHKIYRDEKSVAEQSRPDRNVKTYVTELEISDWAMPLTLEIDAKVPLSRYMGYTVRGNIGYTFLWSKYNNYLQDISSNRRFGGICWQLGAGLYSEIGSRSTLVGDLFYNSSEVSSEVTKSEAGLPIFERVNLSGLGLRVGVLLDLR